MSRTALIELKNVSLNRGATRVFNQLNLRVEQDQHSLVLGPNGAGKSSLIKLILRDLYPLALEGSHVSVLGDKDRDVWALRQQFGIVSDELQHRFDGNETGLQVVASGFYSSIGTWVHQRFDASQLERARELMADLGVAEMEACHYNSLSTGQQRRLLLARALVHDPAYLLLDEPTAGLDPQATFHYLDLMRQLMARGKYLVLVTHHIHEIPPEIEAVILLKQGAIFGQGAKRELLTSQRLSALYDYPLQLVEQGGFYQLFPAS